MSISWSNELIKKEPEKFIFGIAADEEIGSIFPVTLTFLYMVPLCQGNQPLHLAWHGKV